MEPIQSHKDINVYIQYVRSVEMKAYTMHMLLFCRVYILWLFQLREIFVLNLCMLDALVC